LWGGDHGLHVVIPQTLVALHLMAAVVVIYGFAIKSG
jgi:hypothetical protein